MLHGSSNWYAQLTHTVRLLQSNSHPFAPTQLWATTSESVMALCLHELDSRHMLSVALNVLLQCDRQSYVQGEWHQLQAHVLRVRLFLTSHNSRPPQAY